MNFLRRNHKLSIVKTSKAMNTIAKYNRLNFNPMMHRKLHNAVDSIRKPISDDYPQIQVVDLLELSNVLPSSHTTYVAVDPFPNDVICARGRTYWDHPGNEMYRNLISLAVRQYGNAPNRQIKSLIVSQTILHVKKAGGRFVKKAGKRGQQQWVECKINVVREKITQCLRDGLSFKYSSSTTRKRQRKTQVEEFYVGDMYRVIHSNAIVSKKINEFQKQVEWLNSPDGCEGSGTTDEELMELFAAANLDILETMKKDKSMSDQIRGISAIATAEEDAPISGTSASPKSTCHQSKEHSSIEEMDLAYFTPMAVHSADTLRCASPLYPRCA